MAKAVSKKAEQALEEKRKEAKLIARRNRRARKKAEQQREEAAAMEQAAENMHSDAVAAPAPARVNPTVLGVKQQVIAGSASPRRMTEARENLSTAFDMLGGVQALVIWGRTNPTEFYRIWARLIPKEIPQDPAEKLPLETLLAKLSERADMSVQQAALEIGEETLAAAANEVNMQDAIAAFNGSLQ